MYLGYLLTIGVEVDFNPNVYVALRHGIATRFNCARGSFYKISAAPQMTPKNNRRIRKFIITHGKG